MKRQRLALDALPESVAQDLRAYSTNASTGTATPDNAQYITAPFINKEIGWVGKGTPEDVDIAFARARRAQKSWVEQSYAHRKKVFLKFHDLVFKHREWLMDFIQLETGKSRSSAYEEVMDVAINARFYANKAQKFLKEKKVPGALPILTKSRARHVPKGVVGQISPWNYPLTLGISDAIPAFLAGNAVVAKPDSNTPFTSLAVFSLLFEAGLPRDLAQIVTGSGRVVGEAIAQQCDYLMFTGSTATGKHLGKIAGERLIGYSAELGGKNPLIIAKDVDFDMAIPRIIHACFSNTGQLCVSIERIYVEAPVYDEFLRRFKDAIESLRLGSGFDWTVDVGSLASQQQLDTVTMYVEDAKEAGATVLTGAKPRPDLGAYFYEPTVFIDVPDEARLRGEEVFGPVVYVDKVASLDEAVAKANDTSYGLNSSIFAASATAWKYGPRIEAGGVSLNDGYSAGWGSISNPLGGMKESGMGRRHGSEGLLKYTEAQNVTEQRIMPVTGPAMLPRKLYSQVVTALLRAGKIFKILP